MDLGDPPPVGSTPASPRHTLRGFRAQSPVSRPSAVPLPGIGIPGAPAHATDPPSEFAGLPGASAAPWPPALPWSPRAGSLARPGAQLAWPCSRGGE